MKYYELRSSHANVARRALRTPDFVRRISLPFLLFCSVYACMYTHTRVHAHAHTYTRTQTPTLILAHSYTHTRTCTHAHTHTHIYKVVLLSCASTGTYRKCSSCLQVHLHNVYSFYICTCTRIYIHTYVYMHAYI